MSRDPGEGLGPTILLFRDDAKLAVADARVLATEVVNGRQAVILDRTIFYPEGGGQACDSGSVAGRNVLHVEEKSGVVLHFLESIAGEALAQPLPGDSVELVLDSRRRRDFSEQHSAQHLLSATILSLCGAPTLSMHLGAEKSNIDVDIPIMEQALLDRVESLVNERIALNLPVRVHLCPPEDLGSFPLRKRPPEGEAVVRIVDIGGIDYSPCCGTHVASTLELRLLALTGAEKYKGMTRLGFVAGGRALRYLLERSATLDRAASLLGVTVADLPERIAGLSKKLLARESDLNDLVRLAARLRARAAIADEDSRAARVGITAAPEPNAIPRTQERGGWLSLELDGEGAGSGSAFALECARALSGAGRSALVASMQDLTVCVELPEGCGVPGQDSKPLPLAKVLLPLCAASGGRGGGSGLSFRASFADKAGCERFMRAALALVPRRSPATV